MFEIFSLLLGASKRGWPSGKLTYNSFHTGEFLDYKISEYKISAVLIGGHEWARCQVSFCLEIEREG